jgi:hypothetical protein
VRVATRCRRLVQGNYRGDRQESGPPAHGDENNEVAREHLTTLPPPFLTRPGASPSLTPAEELDSFLPPFSYQPSTKFTNLLSSARPFMSLIKQPNELSQLSAWRLFKKRGGGGAPNPDLLASVSGAKSNEDYFYLCTGKLKGYAHQNLTRC